MGKKKEAAPNPAQIANKDVLHRMNFLYQTSMFMQSLRSTGSPARSDGQLASTSDLNEVSRDEEKKGKRGPKRKSKAVHNPEDISRFMVSNLRTISRKTVVPLFVLDAWSYLELNMTYTSTETQPLNEHSVRLVILS